MMLRGTVSKIFIRAIAPPAMLLLTLSLAASAQTPSTRQTPAPSASPTPSRTNERGQSPSSVRDDNADLSITAHVTARELRFEKVPNPTVEFTGKPRRETVWEAERENLPEQVQPGVTYRNVGIRLRITSVFADIDRIVAEALGEIPLSDAPQTSTHAAPQQQPAQTSSAAQTDAPKANTQTAAASKTSPTNVRAAQRPKQARKGRGN